MGCLRSLPSLPSLRSLRLVALCLSGSLLLSSSFANQVITEHDTAPVAIADAMPNARISGEGKFTWFGLKLYDARLWVSDVGLELGQFSNTPFALDIHYSRSLDGKAIAEQSAKEIETLAFGDDSARSRWRDAMIRLFPNVSKGDRLIGIHLPGKATRFWLNGKALGSVDDPEFGSAFFAIWLDPRTKAPRLRQAMIAGAARRVAQ